MGYAQTAESLFEETQKKAGEWEWLRKRIMPRSEAGAWLDENPAVPRKRQHATVAWESLYLLAGAHIMYITPSGQRWFALKSSDKEVKAAEGEWFQQATEIMLLEFAKSNFYTTIYEVFLDRCLTGTGCMFIESVNEKLNFKHIPTGTYGIAENSEGIVDTIARKFKLTANQAVERFGYDKLPQRIQDAYNEEKKRFVEKFEFVHMVSPRAVYKPGHKLINNKKMKYASVYMQWDAEKTVIEESGFHEFPYLVTRYLKFGDSPWGWAPALNVREEIDAVLKLERVLDVLGEIAAFPRILRLAEQVGEVDLRAGGETVVSEKAASMGFPREWATAGRYDVGNDRIEDKENKIRAAFHIPMLQPLSMIERQITAAEVEARQNEKILSFTPSFALFVSDFNPAVHRVFSILFRLGRFDMSAVPKELIIKDATEPESDDYDIAVPSVSYLGKISQAVERAQRGGVESYLQMAIQFAQVTGDTSMLDVIDKRALAKWMYEGTGSPTACLMKDGDLKKLDEARQKEMERQQALEEMKVSAGVEKDMSAAQAK